MEQKAELKPPHLISNGHRWGHFFLSWFPSPLLIISMATTAGDGVSFFLSFFASFPLLKRTPKTATKNKFSWQQVPMVRVFLSFFLSLLSLSLSFQKTKKRPFQQMPKVRVLLSFFPSFLHLRNKTKNKTYFFRSNYHRSGSFFLSFFPSLKTKQNKK